MSPSLLPFMIVEALGSAIRDAAVDPAVPLEPRDAAAIEEDLAARLGADPRLREAADHLAHATNDEPWYQSRVTWGAVVEGAASVASAFGLVLGPDDRDLLVGLLMAAGGLFGAALTLYGRWIAHRPLGAALDASR
jgi:hypothetical protein